MDSFTIDMRGKEKINTYELTRRMADQGCRSITEFFDKNPNVVVFDTTTCTFPDLNYKGELNHGGIGNTSR